MILYRKGGELSLLLGSLYSRIKAVAGHLVCMPYLPSAEICRNLIFTSSNIELSSIAMVKAWHAMLDFFDKYLK